MEMSASSQIDSPENPFSDYAEVQDTNAGKAQSSPVEEAEAGQKLVPRPDDVTSFESAAEPDIKTHGEWSKGTEAVGRSQDYDEKQRRHREQQVSHGHSDQRHRLVINVNRRREECGQVFQGSVRTQLYKGERFDHAKADFISPGRRLSPCSPETKQGNPWIVSYFSGLPRLFGTIENSTKPPIILLHGGPGLVHNYLVPFSDLTVNASVPVILYDQLGNGESTHLRQKPPTFWTIDLFIDELENLIRHFGIQDAFDIAGHSWGWDPWRRWMQSTMQLLQGFPEDVQEGMKVGMKEPERYYAALKRFHAVHGCTLRPVPLEHTYTLDMVFSKDGDPTVASSPILANWSIEDRLHLIRVPTFVINGRADIAQDFVVEMFFQNIQKVKWVTFEKSSHTPHWEERERYMKLVADFLNS
ncbi:hypothetical protein NM688_g3496 [Phlebia brevispora]|uniref:Uncharacterized protein n=1 Tax=Phlebia brevispora TaxID=194682 RepID=A0ACC1T5E9_9APHY|nr:hypothetical protein NM688_g3496 [Phlebia brevispora]